MHSKLLIQFSVDGQVCVPSLLFDLSPIYGGGNEDNGENKIFVIIQYLELVTSSSAPTILFQDIYGYS